MAFWLFVVGVLVGGGAGLLAGRLLWHQAAPLPAPSAPTLTAVPAPASSGAPVSEAIEDAHEPETGNGLGPEHPPEAVAEVEPRLAAPAELQAATARLTEELERRYQGKRAAKPEAAPTRRSRKPKG